MALIVAGVVVHGEDMDEDGGALGDCVGADADVLQSLAQHQRRHTVQPL